MGKNGGQGLGNIGARLEGLLKQKLASIFSYCSYHIIGQNKIKTGQTLVRNGELGEQWKTLALKRGHNGEQWRRLANYKQGLLNKQGVH